MADDQLYPRKCSAQDPCPEPTEIVCIETVKLYDYCFQSERREGICFDIPTACYPPVPADATVTCTVTHLSCDELARVASLEEGFFDVTLRICLDVQITITDPGAVTPRCTFTDTYCFVKTVTLCAPEGTDIQCDIPAYRCGPCYVMPNNDICCEFDLCILVQARATVKLLVPAYGFCTPAECVTIGKPPLVCPPTDLYPPQCDPPATLKRK